MNEACSIIREAANCDDVQINFGVIMNESMGDSVKITVIATGFQPENAPVADRKKHAIPIERAAPAEEPAPASEPVEEIETYEPAPAAMLDKDDLDTPAYLRQGKLLN